MSARSNAGRVGVWGASGSGKSAFVKQRLRGARRVVVFDPLAEYPGTVLSVLDRVRLEMRRNWSGFRVAYVPRAGSEAKSLSALSRLLMAAQQPFKDTGKGSGITLVVEEMNLAFPVSGGAARCPGFAEICSRGRHYGIEVIGVSQRIAEVDTRFRGNCTETVVFRQKGPRDKAAAAAEIGASVAELPRDNLAYVIERAGSLTQGTLKFPANTNSAPKRAKKSA